ncbi:cytidylyltransferase domain-containing protein [Candidatus Latescibacterota bacterium]
MEKLPIIAFIPCRMGSQRIINKNTKKFCGVKGGLTAIKLRQLIRCQDIDSIVVSTNDPKVIKITQDIMRETGKSITIIERPENLCRSNSSTDSLIKYVPEIIPKGIILWTHVTSPFINEKVFSRCVRNYHENVTDGKYDSLMSVSTLRTFIWDEKGPVNYDRAVERWPRTQTLPVYYEINSGIFMSNRENYVTFGDRIGKKPYFFETDKFESIDIDWEHDLVYAERIWSFENNK